MQVLTIGHNGKGCCTCTPDNEYGDVEEINPDCPVKSQSSWVCTVAFSPDGLRVVSGSEDSLAKIWNAETGAEVRAACFAGVK